MNHGCLRAWFSENEQGKASLETHAILCLAPSHPWIRGAFPELIWLELKAALDRLPFERQVRGDVADHHLEVGMIVRNKPAPHSTGPEADHVLSLLARAPIQALFQNCYGSKRPAPVLRRAQCNRMYTGDYNRAHRDSEDDSDYTMAVILYFSDPAHYQGGDIFFEDEQKSIRPACQSLVAFRGDVLHGLKPVVQSQSPRVSLILLFGEHGGPSRSSSR